MKIVARACVLVATIIGLTVSSGAGPAPASNTPKPRSIAAIGDSITRAANVCCWYGDHPANSWSTGSAGSDGVLSHYERLRALDGRITGNNYNDARSGARMSDGPRQARLAVGQRAEYVTILLGANDLCTSSPATMTSVDTFRSQTRETLQVLAAGLPTRARIFVASIPDVRQLWEIYHGDPIAELVWDIADICQSLLAPERTDADRQTVAQRNDEFNAVLAQECAAIVRRCRYDGGAVHNYQFTRADVSKLDYFHPSLTGQAHLAAVTWTASWWN